jgi:hypothetical protein
MSERPDVSGLPPDYRRVRHRSIRIDRLAKGYLATYAVVRETTDEYDGKRRVKSVDDRAAFPSLIEALEFAKEYLADPPLKPARDPEEPL